MGDIHWSQGDGEITFCGAIEMAGWIDIGVDVIKGGMQKYGIINPVFIPSRQEPHFSDYLVFEGISVDENTGKQHYLDAHIAYRRACLNAIEYLKKFGYTGEQAYVILGTAPVEGRISGIVDIPMRAAPWRSRPRSSISTSGRPRPGQRGPLLPEATWQSAADAILSNRPARGVSHPFSPASAKPGDAGLSAPGGGVQMLLGLGLFWVGAVLSLNGLWLLGQIGDQEIGVIDVFVGTLTGLISLYLAFGPGANFASIKGAAFLLLFTFTYFWVAWNRWNKNSGRPWPGLVLPVRGDHLRALFMQTFATARPCGTFGSASVGSPGASSGSCFS